MAGNFQKQMTLWCAAVMLFGLVLAGGAFEATSAGVYVLFAILDGPGAIAYEPALRFALALMGAVTLGWGATVLAVVRGTASLPAQQAAPLWRAITMALLLWYVIDSGLSIATGFWRNAVSNTVIIGWYLLIVQHRTARSGQAQAAEV